MTLKENIEKNKLKAKYFLGIIIAACFKGVMEKLQKYIIADTWWGESLLVITGYAVVAVSLIAPLIFGTDPEIDRVKIERNEFAKDNQRLRVKDEGLVVTNKLQEQIIKENGYTGTYKYEAPKEKKEEEPPDLE